MEDLQIGSIVRSVAGRDKERLFVVTGLELGFAYLADGRIRPIERPKRKKIKHLEPVAPNEGRVGEKLRLHEKVHNSELRRVINEFAAIEKDEPAKPLEV